MAARLPPGLARYLGQRLAQAVGVLWAAYTLAFLILDLLPGDPISLMAGGGLDQTPVDPAQLAQLKAEYGYDQPAVLRYLTGLRHTLRGDFGQSVQTGQNVTAMIRQALPQTALLMTAALVLAVIFGVSLALLATYTRKRWLSQTLLSIPTLGVSLPTFWVGLMLIQVVSFRWGLLPAIGNQGLRSLILPALTLALPTSAVIGQILAKSLLTTLADPYIETATAKGAGRIRIHLRHALPNAAIPVLTMVGVLVGNLLAGSVVIETVFSRNGLGRITVAAVNAQDIPVMQGVVLFGALVFVVSSLLVDLLYPLLDPRIVVAERFS